MYGEPWQVYPALTMDIAYVRTLTSQFDVDVAVAGYTKRWTFHGGHLQDGDQVISTAHCNLRIQPYQYVTLVCFTRCCVACMHYAIDLTSCTIITP
jgi:hypothetical protein